MSVKCEICDFSFRVKNTLDMLISKLAPLSTNIDTTSSPEKLENPSATFEGGSSPRRLC